MKSIWNWIISLFKVSSKSPSKIPGKVFDPERSGTDQSRVKVPVEVPSLSGEMTHNKISDLLIYSGSRYLGAKETGENTDHGGIIDKIIMSMGGKLGHAWCAYFISYIITDVCKTLKISYPEGLYKGGSSQQFWHKSNKKYILYSAKKGSAFIYTYPGQRAKGHIGLCRSGLFEDGSLLTLEGNAGDKITFKTQPKSLVSQVSCYVDVAQAILDQYNKTFGKQA